MRTQWTEKMDNLLRRHYPKGDLRSLAKRLGVTLGAVKGRASSLGIRRKVNLKRPWTPEQLAYLTEHYPDDPIEVLVRKTRHSQGSVEHMAHRLHLHRSAQYMAQIAKRVSQDPRSIASRWKKGHEPHNKGKKEYEFRSPEATAKCRQTQFAKGHRPYNTKPVGYEYIGSRDGIVRLKIADGQPMVHKHRYVWEQHYGKIPENHCIMFLDGDKTNCDISNLYLISRQDACRRMTQNETPEQRRARVAKFTATQRHNDRMDRIRLHFGLPTKGKRIKRW